MHDAPIIVISGSIGSGKGTVIHALVNELPLTWVPTHTTRTMRKDDSLLSNRIFDTEATFERYIERDAFIEHTEVANNSFGLLKDDLEQIVKARHGAILELSVSGGVALNKIYPQALLIFITAPEASRRERIAHRHMDPSEQKQRMAESDDEEKQAHEHYDYIVENPDHLPHLAIHDVRDLILDHFPELNSTQ